MKFYLSKLTSYFRFIVTLMAFELFSLVINSVNAQENRTDYIRSVKLYRQGDQTSFPVLILNSADVLELDFDDMSNTFRNYYYTFQLCNADWSPSMLHSFEYISGFENNRITTYRNSSISNARYIYYQAMLPDRNCYPNKSGNYLLKVFIDNDTSNLVFSRRMIVVDNQASISAQIQQPYSASLFNVAQKLQVS
ncbi:MAG: type IX secretion system plug protein domain-containing protein, partial [Flavisolibacter sp.]